MSASINPKGISRLCAGPGQRGGLDLKYLRSFCESLWGEDLHAKRVESMANGAAGVLHGASLGIHAIGAGYAALSANQTRHGIKLVDRLLSNEALDVWSLAGPWVRFVLSGRPEVVVALDWTEFDADDHSTICAYLITRHGRATPLLWWTTQKSKLKDNRTEHEHALVSRLAELMPAGVRATLLADRGFGDQAFYTFLSKLGWDYVIRFRECIEVEDSNGVCKPAGEWVGEGRAKMLKSVRVTGERTEVPAVVVVHAKGMKHTWCLATSKSALKAADGGGPLWQALPHRGNVSRREGLSLWNGTALDAHFQSRTPRPTALPCGAGAQPAHVAGRRQRGRGPRPLVEGQHLEEAHAFTLSPRASLVPGAAQQSRQMGR